MRTVDLIEKKVEGKELTTEEIAYLIRGFLDGTVPDYQMAAMQMAIVFRGMTDRESTDLTIEMMHSGDVVDLSALKGVKVDKHSTGGVGDTTTLVVAPLAATCGCTVAKMSGRGLGHTGGTLDKLESIPGTQIEIPMDRFIRIVDNVGVAVIGQSGNLDPADKRMYALRDVTATVRSIPLIASSIMSKKLAAGADAIVLDVKVGSGAFMNTVEQARELAKLMVEIGKRMGRRVVAIITDMNQPLGLAVGNALEVREAVQLLSGAIPKSDPLYKVCMLLGVYMLLVSEITEDIPSARAMLEKALESGAGLKKLQQMITAQGGDASYLCMQRIDELCRVKEIRPIYPKREGYIAGIEAVCIGNAAQMLGAGRATKTDVIDPAVGLVMQKRYGEYVKADEPLCYMYINDATKAEEAIKEFHRAFTFSDVKPEDRPMVYDVIGELP